MKKHGLIGLVLLSVVVGGTACSKKTATQTNVLKVALKDDVKTLDPANAYDSVSWDVLPNIVDTLLQYKYLEDQAILEPLLADGMPVYSKDGKTVTIKIKKGVLYADDAAFKATAGKGRELKAQDFILEFKRLAIPALQSQGSWIFEGKVVGFSEFQKKLQGLKGEAFKKVFDETYAGFKAIDDYTLEIKLNEAYPTLNYILAMPFTAPIPQEALDAYADADGNLREHPIGTGPYVLKSWKTGQGLYLEKNLNYRENYPSVSNSARLKDAGFLADAGKPLPFINALQFEIIKEDQPRLLKFQSGEIDTFELTKDSFRASMENGSEVKADLAKLGVQAEWEDSLVMYYIGFNMRDKILSNKLVRQAISSAIDREKWIDVFEKYCGTKMDQLTPPGLADRVKSAGIKYDFNIEKGKALLAKAGYPEGKGLPTLNFDFRGAETRYRQMGELFVQQLGAIGIKVNVILNTFPAYLEKAKQGNLQISLGGWNFDYPDVENGYQLLFGPNKAPGPNEVLFENAQYDALYRKVSAMPAGVKGRKELVQQMEALVQEELPWAYGYFRKTYRLRHGFVKNFRVAETIQNKYKYMRIAEPTKVAVQ
jgi:oligopeptide transport system substrate-binding protein